MKDDFDTYSLFGGDAAGGATPREPAKRSSLRAARPASTRSRYRSDVLSGDAYGFRAPEPVRETRAAVISVSDICRGIQNSLRAAFPPAWVEGEIASFMVASSGHCYFDLKDREAQISCVMYRSQYQSVGFEPKVGDKIEVYAEPSLYMKRGRLQLTVNRIRKSGLGALYEEFLRLKAKLESEGLFSLELKRPVPSVPRTAAIVTSLKAAGLRDVIQTFEKRAPYVALEIYPASVQGSGAAAEIAEALRRAGESEKAEVILLVRGGGSFEDLACFNDERVARAIRMSPIPVITGIGHESDTTIADLAADLRAATPTAAAEHAAAAESDLMQRLGSLVNRLKRAEEGVMREASQRLDMAETRLGTPEELLRGGRAALQLAEEKIRKSPLLLIQGGRSKLSEATPRLRRRLETVFGRAELQPIVMRNFLEDRLKKSLQEETKRLRNSESEIVSHRPKLDAEGRRLDAAASGLRGGLSEKLKQAEETLTRATLFFSGADPGVSRESARLGLLAQRLATAKPAFRESGKDLLTLRTRLAAVAASGLDERRTALRFEESKMKSLEVSRVLERGFALLYRDAGIVRSVKSLRKGESVTAVLPDGEASLTVSEVHPKQS